MLVGSYLLIIIILCFAAPLIPAASPNTGASQHRVSHSKPPHSKPPHDKHHSKPSHDKHHKPSHDAVRLNILETSCEGRRRNISVATFDPIKYLPDSGDLPCAVVTPDAVNCEMSRYKSDPLRISVNIKARACNDDEYQHVNLHVDGKFTVVPGSLCPSRNIEVLPPTIGYAKDLAKGLLDPGTSPYEGGGCSGGRSNPGGHNAVRLNIFSAYCGGPGNYSVATFYPAQYLPGSEDLPCVMLTPDGISCRMTRLKSKPLRIGVTIEVKICADSDPNDPSYDYLEVDMQVDSNFNLVPGTPMEAGITVKPPTRGYAKDFATGISPSGVLANCAAGFMFGAGTILKAKLPQPTDCVDAHAGIQGFTNHVVVGSAYSGYITDKDIQALPGADSRALIVAATNGLEFYNNLHDALYQAYDDAQSLVRDMKSDLIPEPEIPSIHVNVGDALIAVGLFLPVITWAPVAPAAFVIGASLVLAGTLMAENQEDPVYVFQLIKESRLQVMRDTTNDTFNKTMTDMYFTEKNYTGFDSFSTIPKDMTPIQDGIKQTAVTWAANITLNYYNLKICDNPDDFAWCGCDDSGWITVCNDKIQGTDCRLANGFGNGGGGYYYSANNGHPTGNIAGFTKYLPNGSFDDLCANRNGWSLSKGPCGDDDYRTYYDSDQCPNKDDPPGPPCC